MCLILLLLPLIASPFVIDAAATSWENNNNDVISWADDDLPVKKQFTNFTSLFGREELIVASWPQCSPSSNQLRDVADSLQDDQHAEWFVNVTTAAILLDKISQQPGRTGKRDLLRDLRGLLFSDDGTTACLTVGLGPKGKLHRPQAIERIKQTMAGHGIARGDIKIGGIGAELAWIDWDSVEGPRKLLPFTAAVSLILCILMVRSIAVGVFITLLGGFTGVLSAALIQWAGVPSNAVIATLPTLGGLLAISLSLHFWGYYRNATLTTPSSGAALRQAFRWALRPTIISALTTALGLASLLASRTLTIQQFGAFGATITLCAAGLTLSIFPAYLGLLRIRPQDSSLRSLAIWNSWAACLNQHARKLVIVILLSVVILGSGLVRLKTGVHADSLFPAKHEVIQSDRWLEANIGPLSSVELVVTHQVASDDDTNMARELTQIQRLINHIRDNPDSDFQFFVSAATGMPAADKFVGLSGVAARTRLNKWLVENRQDLIESGLLAETEGRRYWRVSARIPSVTNRPIREICSSLDADVGKFFASDKMAKSETKSSFYVTGLPLLFEQIEQQFIEDLLITYLGGLFLITLAVLAVLRNIIDALVAMIPNVLPATVVLGGLSFAGVELDVGSIMTASIALGVAVDDTLHFMLWYQNERAKGQDSKAAVRSAIKHCGSPIAQTSIICGAGLFLFAFAPFLPTIRFGTLIASMLCVALVGDLILLPAMLSLRKRGLATE